MPPPSPHGLQTRALVALLELVDSVVLSLVAGAAQGMAERDLAALTLDLSVGAVVSATPPGPGEGFVDLEQSISSTTCGLLQSPRFGGMPRRVHSPA